MSDLAEELSRLAKDLKLENLQLSERDHAAFAVEKHKAETMRRDQEQRARDEASYDERCRQHRHHDVLCLVLKATIEGRMNIKAAGLIIADATPEGLVDEARELADLAYPPPKAEGT